MPGAEGWRAVCVMLAKQVHFPEWTQRFLLFPAALTRGEILGATLFVALNLLVIPFRVHRSLSRGAKKLTFLRVKGSEEPIPATSFQAVEVWAKTIGLVSIMNLGWYLMMPIGRKSVLLEMFGVSWEYAIKWHRMIGAYTIGLILAHSVLYFVVWIHGDGHPDYDPEGKMVEHNLLRCDSSCDEDQELMFRTNMYGLVTLACIIVMAVTSMPSVRRRHFELFYYAHHLFLVLLVFTCLHYGQAIIYLIPGLGIYSVDKACRVLACRGGVWAEVELVTDDVVELRVPLDSRASYKAGWPIHLPQRPGNLGTAMAPVQPHLSAGRVKAQRPKNRVPRESNGRQGLWHVDRVSLGCRAKQPHTHDVGQGRWILCPRCSRGPLQNRQSSPPHRRGRGHHVSSCFVKSPLLNESKTQTLCTCTSCVDLLRFLLDGFN